MKQLVALALLFGMLAMAQLPRPGGGVSGSGSGGVAVSCTVSRTNSTTLTIGACSARIGEASVTTSSATVVISAGTGTAYIYLDSAGVVTVGHNGLTIDSCTGCTATSGVTTPPATSLPLYSWPATSGTWDSSGEVDSRVYLNRDLAVAGTGLTAAVVGGISTLSVDGAVVPTSPNIDFELQVFAPGTTHTTGDGKAYLFVPARLDGKVLSAVHAQTITAGTVSGTLTVQVARCAAVTSGNVCSGTVTDMLSTVLTVDAGEDSSDTAAAPAVIDTAADDVNTNQVIRVDVDAVHGTAGAGLVLTLTFAPA